MIRWFLNLFRKIRIPGMLNKHQLGMYKDIPDERDYVATMLVELLPTKHQITNNPYKYVKNQGSWNSCASHAMCTAMELFKEGTNREVELSEQHHYYWARQLDYMNNFPNNEGMYARVMLNVAQQIGLTPEKLAPYISSKMNDTPGQFAEGFTHWWKIKYYYRVIDIETMKSFISLGYPVLIGVYTTSSFNSNTGPIVAEGNKLGGHEVVIYGYDDETEEMLCINSWTKNYKDNGCMRLPYNYFDNYGIDMWTFDT